MLIPYFHSVEKANVKQAFVRFQRAFVLIFCEEKKTTKNKRHTTTTKCIFARARSRHGVEVTAENLICKESNKKKPNTQPMEYGTW